MLVTSDTQQGYYISLIHSFNHPYTIISQLLSSQTSNTNTLVANSGSIRGQCPYVPTTSAKLLVSAPIHSANPPITSMNYPCSEGQLLKFTLYYTTSHLRISIQNSTMSVFPSLLEHSCEQTRYNISIWKISIKPPFLSSYHPNVCSLLQKNTLKELSKISVSTFSPLGLSVLSKSDFSVYHFSEIACQSHQRSSYG